MSTSHNDPLSPEEQTLASRLRALGGPDGPSAALDARILAAARHPLAKPASLRRRRWPAWMGIPGGVITAVGTAAAFVLAVGVVWHTQPPTQPRPARESHATDDGFIPVEVIGAPVQTAAPAATSPAATNAPATAAKQAPASPRAAGSPRPLAPAPDATGSTDAAATAVPLPAAETTAIPAIADDPAPPQPQAASPVAAPAPGNRSGLADSAPSAARNMPRADIRRPTYTTSARARPEARSPSPARLPSPAGDAPAGARATDELPPVADDARLAPGEWIERIRERRARDETGAAIESLRRFRQRHPDVPLPADLRELAE